MTAIVRSESPSGKIGAGDASSDTPGEPVATWQVLVSLGAFRRPAELMIPFVLATASTRTIELATYEWPGRARIARLLRHQGNRPLRHDRRDRTVAE
jgi:hypothetical protein